MKAESCMKRESRLYRVLAVGVFNRDFDNPLVTPEDELRKKLPKEILMLIGAAFVQGHGGDLCETLHDLCSKLRHTSRGFNLCDGDGFWEVAYRMLLHLPMTAERSANLRPHEAQNYNFYDLVRLAPDSEHKWQTAFEQACSELMHTNDTLREAVLECSRRGDWNHAQYGLIGQWRVHRVTDMVHIHIHLHLYKHTSQMPVQTHTSQMPVQTHTSQMPV